MWWNYRRRIAGVGMLVGFAAPMSVVASPASQRPAEIVQSNDNRHQAGTLAFGTLWLRIRAAEGTWRPEGADGPALSIEALGEESAPLTVPAPLIRVAEGTRIAASIRNDLAAPLAMHGLCARDGSECPPVIVAPHQTADVHFPAPRAGTYHYWGSTLGAPVPFRELAGAFVVDPPGPVDDDRIIVITEWSSLTGDELRRVVTADDADSMFASLHPRIAFMLNGLSWPATERLRYPVGKPVHWRVINLTSQSHPMHLHGFYFHVNSLGDGMTDVPVTSDQAHSVVTQLLRPGTTMALTWTPERAGNWLFHCHVMHHVSPERRLAPTETSASSAHDHCDKAGGMAGMVLGVTAFGGDPDAGVVPALTTMERRVLKLEMAREESPGGPVFGFRVSGDRIPASAASQTIETPGPTLVLRRGEPVEISVVNHLGESTALHWHGMELESYYDGVHGWSGLGDRLAPMIDAGGTFVVRFTPPRTGTFMYHTHLHDERQLPLGLYGPMIVVDAGDDFDAVTDHVFMIGRRGIDPAAPNVLIPATPVVVNGGTAPRFVWKSGVRHRVRLINITPGDIFSVSLQTAQGLSTWTPVTKDGAPLPAAARVAAPARQTIAVGETYDFEVDVPPGVRQLWLEVRTTSGKWQAQGQVVLR